MASTEPFDAEFFFDTSCPWAFVASRWLTEVQRLRGLSIGWRFLSLHLINGDLASDAHRGGLYVHRVCDAVREQYGNEAVGALFTTVGNAAFPGKRKPEIHVAPVAFLAEMLADAGLPSHLAEHACDESHDGYIERDTDLALGRVGADLGTPIITVGPGSPHEASYFGPVVSPAPGGDDALRLYDALAVLATTPGMAEYRRARAPLRYD